MAIRDEAPLVAPYPDDYFQEPTKSEPPSAVPGVPAGVSGA